MPSRYIKKTDNTYLSNISAKKKRKINKTNAMRPRWTKIKIEILVNYIARGFKPVQIARMMYCSVGSISGQMFRLNNK